MSATVGKLLEEAIRDLARLAEAPREAQVLLGHILRVSRAWLAAHGEDHIDPATASHFRELVLRRRAGEPVAYLVGRREFYGLDYK
ncbi:MAG: protein-(glutamine-N5) methyltransferase, release factor-specific, partial [Betaproteobacteria bacterium]